MDKYLVEITDKVIPCKSWSEAVTVAKANQPSTILRGNYVITHFPIPGEKSHEN
jgi:hypothetical protein